VHDPDWLYKVAGLSIGCITEMSAIILVYCLPGVPRAFSETSVLRKLTVSLRSWVQSTTNRTRNTNTHDAHSSDTDVESSGHAEQLDSSESVGGYRGRFKHCVPVDQFHAI
jgi:hypothetical protein